MDSIHRWLNDVQEELMDAILYLQKCKEMTTDMLEEKLLKDFTDDDRLSSWPESNWVSTCTVDCGSVMCDCKFNVSQ